MSVRLPLLVACLVAVGLAAVYDRVYPSGDERVDLVGSDVRRVRQAPAVEPRQASNAVASLNPLASLPLDRFAAIVQRPLFNPTRRAAEDDRPVGRASGSAAEMQDDDLALVGVVTGNDGGVAILHRRSDGASIRLRRGQAIDGWTLRDMTPRAIMLMLDGSVRRLELPAIRVPQIAGRVRDVEDTAPDVDKTPPQPLFAPPGWISLSIKKP